MGYYTRITDVECVIPRDKRADAYRAFCDLGTREGLMRAGMGHPDTRTHWHFAFMPHNFPDVLADEVAVLKCMDFEVEELPNGDLAITGYDNKRGQEELFMAWIAPLVVGRDGKPAFMEWIGEDNWQYRWEFRDDALWEYEAGLPTWESTGKTTIHDWIRASETRRSPIAKENLS